MKYHHYSTVELDTYPICILANQIQISEIRNTYIDPFNVPYEDVLVVTLDQEPGKKKSSKKHMVRYIEEELKPVFDNQDVQIVLCTDSEYFKALTGLSKSEAYLGYVCNTQYGVKAVYLPTWKAIFYDPPKVRAKIDQAMNAVLDYANGVYQDPGSAIIKHMEVPRTLDEIKDALQRLWEMDCDLTVDIEAFSLKHYSSGIGTITLCWNEGCGVVFPIDYAEIPGAIKAPYGYQIDNVEVKKALRVFFENFKRRAIYHQATFDISILIYQLFMKDICDTEGLLYGMDIMMRNWECTKLITYLATNSCAENKLSLKDQSQIFAGDYGMGAEIKDITKIPLDKLLTYNLKDGLSTWFTYNKNWQKMIDDDQYTFYVEHFKKYALDIVQMQLTGMPILMERTKEVNKQIGDQVAAYLASMQSSPVIQKFNYWVAENWANKKNAKLKKKRVTVADCPDVFNPNSHDQLQVLLFEQLGLPVLELTDTKKPSTNAEVIKALVNHTKNPQIIKFLEDLREYSLINKIYTTFLPAMLKAQLGPDGQHYLFGSYNLGGALSGRLSSSDPNLQNLPAKGPLGKLIKSCFGIEPGVRKVFCGLDFASLEDRISALTTKDPNKLKVYTDGYDGHCLRAYSYFSELMPDINPASVASINSIEQLYKDLRGESKAPTFALTYQGTYHTLMKNCGFSKEKAMLVESRFKELYKVSIEWVANKLNQAAKDGYITGAFGLRVRTPLLAQVIRGNSRTPYEAEAEGRSAGNALGQSWCLLNNRASAAFMGRVRVSDYRLKIRLSAHIHDAQYFIIDEDLETLQFVNKYLVQEVQWQDHPDIAHDEVKLGGELSIFYPHWGKEIVIPNGASNDEVLERIDKALAA